MPEDISKVIHDHHLKIFQLADQGRDGYTDQAAFDQPDEITEATGIRGTISALLRLPHRYKLREWFNCDGSYDTCWDLPNFREGDAIPGSSITYHMLWHRTNRQSAIEIIKEKARFYRRFG